MSTLNITKDIVTHIDPAPVPDVGSILQVRSGKVKDLYGEPSGIYKTELEGRIYVGTTGIVGDEHVYKPHGGIERAVLQYASSHYASWRTEPCPQPSLFDYGAFGENIVGTNMTEENVCVGDLFRVGKDVVLQVSEPRNPCYKLNKRFQWPRALKRIQRTARVGWLYRVLHTGYIEKGDGMVLIARPHPRWSLVNVKRVLQGKEVALPLVQELAELEELTELVRDLALRRLEITPKSYTLVASALVTPRVRKLTFELNDTVEISHPSFRPHSYAKIDFGPGLSFTRAYSIVSGDLNKFSLGISLDDHSRGGSAYMHKKLQLGEKILMAPGTTEDEEGGDDELCIRKRVVIIGGIGVTAFLPTIEQWEAEDLTYEVHYAVRSPEDAAFLDRLQSSKTKIYAKSRKERLCVDAIIPGPIGGEKFETSIYACGPAGLMDACKRRVESLGYPDHLVHFESFGTATGAIRGEPFEVEVSEVDSGRKDTLEVSSEMTLLQTLRAAGFDMTSFCESGGCGSCRVTVCEGSVRHIGTGLPERDRKIAMLSCVDRGEGKIKIELD